MYPMSTIYAMRSLGEWVGRNAQVCTGWRPPAVTENANPIRGYKRQDTILYKCTALWGESCIALQALHAQFLWQQSAASDSNQERQHTLANCCSLSSAVSSALCCRSRSLLLRSFSCHTVSTQVYIRFAIHDAYTTARADSKELSIQKALCRSKLKGGMVTTVWKLCFSYDRQLCCDESSGLVTTMPTQEHFTPYCCFRQPL